MKDQAQTGPQSKAAADGKRNGRIGYASPVVQRYSESEWQGAVHRTSDDGNMKVKLNAGDRLFAKNAATRAANVLVAGDEVDGYRSYAVNAPHVKDCGTYAIQVWRKILNAPEATTVVKRTIDYDGGPKEYKGQLAQEYQKEIDYAANPEVGQAYYALSDPTHSKVISKEHYNFHWAVVVAKSGNDVVTAEADPNANAGWLQMYHYSTLGQRFKDHYVAKDKLADSAKIFLAKSTAEPKPQPETIDL